MAKFEIFFYRPDIKDPIRLAPYFCYTAKGQPYQDWVADRQLEQDIKNDKLKKRIFTKPIKHKHFIEDYWR